MSLMTPQSATSGPPGLYPLGDQGTEGRAAPVGHRRHAATCACPFTKYPVTHDSKAARVVLASILLLLETHGQALDLPFAEPRRCSMRTCDREAKSPWDLINHLLKCRETPKGDITCRECKTKHEIKYPMSPVHLWRRLSGGRKHDMNNSPSLSQPSKRSKVKNVDGGHDAENFEENKYMPGETYGSSVNLECLEMDAHCYEYVMHESPQLLHSTYMREAAAYATLITPQEGRPLPEMEAHVPTELPPYRQPLAVDTSAAQKMSAPQLTPSWSGSSEGTTLYGSSSSGTTGSLGLFPWSAGFGFHRQPETPLHGQYQTPIDPKLSFWPSGSPWTRSPEDGVPDASGTGQAPWEGLWPGCGKAIPADGVRHHYGNASIMSPPDVACVETGFGVCRGGVTQRDLAGSSGPSQTDWSTLIPSPLATPIRAVSKPRPHVDEERPSNPSGSALEHEHEHSAPAGPAARVSAAAGPTRGPLVRRNAIRSTNPSLTSPNAAASEDDALSSSGLGQEEDGKCPVPDCTFHARGKKNRRTHLKRHMKTHQNIEPLRCPYNGCSSTFASGREDNLKQHLSKVHRLSSGSAVPDFTAADVQQARSLGSSESGEADQSGQDAMRWFGGWGEEEGPGSGPDGVSMPFNRRSNILNGILSDRNAQEDISQAPEGLPVLEEVEDGLNTPCNRPPPGDLPATAWNASWL